LRGPLLRARKNPPRLLASERGESAFLRELHEEEAGEALFRPLRRIVALERGFADPGDALAVLPASLDPRKSIEAKHVDRRLAAIRGRVDGAILGELQLLFRLVAARIDQERGLLAHRR